MAYRCLIVEDEAPAQRVLKKFISDVPTLQLVDCTTNALDALSILKEQKIDILFLDINLPKIKGIDFLKSIQSPPKTIFTTAYAEYAVESFELDATDYLLKPFSFERFLKAVNKAIDRISASIEPTAVATKFENEQILFFRTDKKIFRLNLSELIYIEGEKDYVKIVTLTTNHLILQTMKHWEKHLPSNQFKRIHKSFIVNLKRINSINGNVVVIGEKEIPIGRNFKESLLSEIENKYLI